MSDKAAQSPPRTNLGDSKNLIGVYIQQATEQEYEAHIAACAVRILATSLAMLTDIDMVTIGPNGVVFHTTSYGGAQYLLNVTVEQRRKDVPEDQS